jgi:hypothetical protein
MPKTIRIFLILSTSAMLGLMFTNCNKIQMTDIALENDGLIPFGEPPDTTVVQQTCANGTPQKMSINYTFPKPNQTCAWNQDGNLSPRDRFLQGRIEQEKMLSLAPNSIICDVKFKFAQQQFLYDDHFLVTFNNAVIASSYDFSAQLSRGYDLLRYNWSKIAGMVWTDDKEGVFCAPNSQCSWPDTDKPGVINMNYPSLVFQKLMAEDLNRIEHSIKFVSIGDNDNMDCEHSEVNFTLDVEFVTKNP